MILLFMMQGIINCSSSSKYSSRFSRTLIKTNRSNTVNSSSKLMMSSTSTSCYKKESLTEVRNLMSEMKIDALIVPTDDPHMSEYTASFFGRREFISGFTGSAGTVVITRSKAALWTDGRYFDQAEAELGESWTLMKAGLSDTPSTSDFLATEVGNGGIVGIDPEVHAVGPLKKVMDTLSSKGIEVKSLKNNIIDWHLLSEDKSINIEYTNNNVLLVHKSLLNKVDISNIFFKHDTEYIKCIIDEFNLTHLANNINFFILNERGVYNFNNKFSSTHSDEIKIHLQQDIKQIVLSRTIHWIKDRFKNIKKPVIITETSNLNNNTKIDYNLVSLLIGYYENERRQKLKDNFKNKLYILWGGSDCLVKKGQIFNDSTHICISKIIYNKLIGCNRIYDCLISRNLKDIFMYKPIKKNSSIYFYCPVDVIYKRHIINFLKSKLPFINFYTYEKKLTNKSDIINLYSKCFLGLRLTCFDGNANTSIELGLMGRKCICLNDYPNCIHWNFENLYKIIDFIEKEYKLLNTDNIKYNICARKIREDCIEYINKYSNIL